MNEEQLKRVPQDEQRVDTQDEPELLYWTERFGVSRAQLVAAVDAAGPMANAVEHELLKARGVSASIDSTPVASAAARFRRVERR